MAKDTATRKLILQESAWLFAEKSFSRVSMREIAAHVGVTPASLYYYFPAKEDILDELIDFFLTLTRRTVEQTTLKITSEGYKPALSDINYRYTPEEAEMMRAITRILVMEQFNHPKAAYALFTRPDQTIHNGYRSFLNVLVKHGYIKKRKYLPVYTQMFSKIAQGYQMQYLHPDIDAACRQNIFETLELLMKLILSFEGTADRFKELVE